MTQRIDVEGEELIKRSLEALHALNRRAKEKRDRLSTYRRATFSRAVRDEIDRIYRPKDRFLEALIRAGYARVERFTIKRISGWSCHCCDREWRGFGRQCFDCGRAGQAKSVDETWFVIDCGRGFRFHQPALAADLAVMALEVPPHEPTQPAREIPKVGLTIEAQFRAIELAVERLSAPRTPPAVMSS